MTHLNRYAVEGSGPFPADMLRYDEARFADASSEQVATEGNQDDCRILVRLTTERSANFLEFQSAKRWHSFGWKMVEVNGKPPMYIGLGDPPAPTREHLEARLRQTWADQEALRELEKELIHTLAPMVAEFKEGDILACSLKGKYFLVRSVHGRPNHYRRADGDSCPVEAVYNGSPLKKDGTAGKNFGHIWHSGLRLATPEELAAHKGEKA